MRGTIGLAFVLLLVFMLLIYYVGLQSDLGAVQGLVTSAGNTYSGRNSSGVAAAYPA